MKFLDSGKNKSKIQSIITVSSIMYSMIHGIIGYIAVYFFKPVWEKLMSIIRNTK